MGASSISILNGYFALDVPSKMNISSSQFIKYNFATAEVVPGSTDTTT
jgi:hypothetical protein